MREGNDRRDRPARGGSSDRGGYGERSGGRPSGNRSFGGGGYGGGDSRPPRNFSSGPREMHKATCGDCGVDTEVPFKPTEGRPVYCRDCFSKHKPQY